jgi:hypothetical protein
VSKLHLHPLAATLHWQLPTVLPVEGWASLLKDYVSALAGACESTGPVVIGHIKALALLPDGGFVRASAISATHPVDAEIQAKNNDELQELALTVNVIVYGLPFDIARKIVIENAQKLIEIHSGNLVIETITEEGTHSHDHDHD